MNEAAVIRPPRRRGGVIATTLLFLTLGPPIGGLTLWAGVVSSQLIASAGLGGLAGMASGDIVPLAFFGLIYFVPFSYLAGGLHALAAGIIVALWQRFNGPISRRALLLLAVVAGLSYAALAFGLRGSGELALPLIGFAAAAAPTLLCGAIARSFAKAAE